METIRTGLVGCGKVGRTHALALNSLPESNFLAVCDKNTHRAQILADEYGVRAYADVRDMISELDVQAVIVCVPHPLHAAITIQATSAGAHVLVEKPMAASLVDCDAMITAAYDAGVKLGVITQRRLYPPVRRVKNAIEAGKIGQPVLGTVTMLGWRDEEYYHSDPWRGRWDTEGGGVLVNQAPHQLDLLQWFMGPISELFAYWANANHPYIEVEDTAVAILRFRNGGLGSIVVSNSQHPALYGKVHVHGANGATVGVQTDGGAMFVAGMSKIEEPSVNDLWTVADENHLLAEWQAEDEEMFKSIDATTYYHCLQVQDFLRAILEDHKPMVDGIEGRKVVEMFTAIYRSQRDQRPVIFPLPAEDGFADFDGRRSLA